MRNQDWQRARSEFNHGWLKNRLLVGLLKCMRVAEGQVEDREVVRTLAMLLNQWPEMRSEAARLLRMVEERIVAPMDPQTSDAAVLSADDCRFLLEVERQLWLVREQAPSRLAEARQLLEAINQDLTKLNEAALDGELKSQLSNLEACVKAARGLGEQFSKLTVPRDCILC